MTNEEQFGVKYARMLEGFPTSPKCMREVAMGLLHIADMLEERNYTTTGGLMITVSADGDRKTSGYTIESNLSIVFPD